MAIPQTMLCRVRPGAVLPHLGRDYVGGEEVALPHGVALEVAHLVDRVVGPDTVERIDAPDELEQLQAQLNRHRPHERISLLTVARQRLLDQVAEIDRLIQGERAPAAEVVPKSRPAASAKKKDDPAPAPKADSPAEGSVKG